MPPEACKRLPTKELANKRAQVTSPSSEDESVAVSGRGPSPAPLVGMSRLTSSSKEEAESSTLRLSDEQHPDMADWLKERDLVRVKGRSKYRDAAVKLRLWKEKSNALSVGSTGHQGTHHMVRVDQDQH